ncbi:hypothetical protein HOS55_gp094 [Pseudomonas phage PMBT3]|uniref:Uncharacterized protein n=1 Tax=Pseudomonas phage PMBT3 TaxID=2059856 RepID=A0A2I6PI13_9CAUD|nr:hypothetical protein HOS55_gp094 [Pseudomonas phage PMBT3]AUM59696.1 hypothetical protein [Pseudomonas phage PMBT3]
MKYYKNTAECVHAWAGRHSDNGRNPNSSVFFTGKIIYSYGSHFPMARHISFNDVLLTYATYSNTTSKHQHEVWSSVSHKNTLYVHDVEDPLSKNGIDETISAVTTLLHTASKRRKKELANDDIHSAWQQVANLYEIAAFDDFKAQWKKTPAALKRRLADTAKLIEACKVNITAAMSSLSAKEEARIKRERAAAEKKRKAQVGTVTAELEAWFNGERATHGMHNVRQILGTDGLRLGPTGLTVDTTQGLVVPAEDCRRAWPLIKRFYDSKYSDGLVLTEAQSARFGNFQLSRIEKDGSVVVGCHRFARWVVERLASQLELTS